MDIWHLLYSHRLIQKWILLLTEPVLCPLQHLQIQTLMRFAWEWVILTWKMFSPVPPDGSTSAYGGPTQIGKRWVLLLLNKWVCQPWRTLPIVVWRSAVYPDSPTAHSFKGFHKSTSDQMWTKHRGIKAKTQPILLCLASSWRPHFDLLSQSLQVSQVRHPNLRPMYFFSNTFLVTKSSKCFFNSVPPIYSFLSISFILFLAL